MAKSTREDTAVTQAPSYSYVSSNYSPCGVTTQVRVLRVVFYGSHYRLVRSEEEKQPFEWTLETAIALRAPTIRVWAGGVGSADASPPYRRRVEEESRRVAALAAAEGLSIAYEFQGGTLTDTNASAAALLRAVDHENVRTYWQPNHDEPLGYNLDGLRTVLPWLTHVHVHHFGGDGPERKQFPLGEGHEQWTRYLEVAAAAERERFALLEFVAGGTVEQLGDDARVLKQWLNQANG